MLVQSKWIHSGIGEPSAADVSVFVDGIKDLIENNLDAFGERLQDKADEISLHLMQPGTTVRIVLASTRASALANPAQTKLDRLISELNEGDEDGSATFEVIGMTEVFAGLAEGARAGKIALNATLLDWSRVSHPQKAYFGIIDGSQLKSWWSSHGKRLVDQNIRYGLGNTPVNEEIQETAENRPEHFWYFHNGITLIADEVSRAPSAAASHSSGNFEFRGASIVNGAQTVSKLSKVEDDEALGRVRTSIRAVILDEAPDNFGADVTRTNNLQNRVEGRDFVANDPQHTRLRGEMSMEGIDYQFHRSEDFQCLKRPVSLLKLRQHWLVLRMIQVMQSPLKQELVVSSTI
ncbi:AIPR family protein [Planktotalea sp.]|uniref:AIPR family protein n=1 Tax=Planktotalea sp. TaxID=2029877 RepID=UPI0035C7AF63